MTAALDDDLTFTDLFCGAGGSIRGFVDAVACDVAQVDRAPAARRARGKPMTRRPSRDGAQTSASTASTIQNPESGWRPGRHRANCEWTDWASGPPAHVILSCGHEHDFKPPSPAKGDLVTCGACGQGAVVVDKPVRRLDRHAPPLAPEEVRPALEHVVYGKGLRLHTPPGLQKDRR